MPDNVKVIKNYPALLSDLQRLTFLIAKLNDDSETYHETYELVHKIRAELKINAI